jgi:hypothetical protein
MIVRVMQWIQKKLNKKTKVAKKFDDDNPFLIL